jgi:hypothetical protein
MSTRRERAKAPAAQLNKQLEPVANVAKRVNQRQEKLANFLIDVAKYVLTGVIIASLFEEMTDKLSLYLLGMSIVFAALWVGLRLSSKTKE